MIRSASARGRTLAVLTCCATLLGGVAALGSQGRASAAPPPVPSPAAMAKHASVTLLTGHTVTLAGDQVLSVTDADGLPAEFETRRLGDALHVLPLEANPLIARGLVDEALFDVWGLIRSGYDDAHTAGIPVLASYGTEGRAAATAVLPAASVERRFARLGTTALTVRKADAREFWRAIGASGSARSASAPRKVWLDAKVSTALDSSVAQIGAPEAWAAGLTGKGVKVAVLDTGYDAGHPDLAGRVSASKDFTGKGSVADGHGHGTHVAATVAGSGAGSDGRRKGVAPDADLIVGKVLADSGSGAQSGILAGMEWAVAEGADIVSMSLGGETGGECDNPLADAVERLSATGPALFVLAAGNSGPGASTVNSPGCARSALTVAAADRELATASFSSRGDVWGADGKHWAKPDISAPGVGIVAARAAGTSMGKPVDDLYTAANGTSMATPHVAGAAALLAGQHPDWTGARLKQALTSSVRPAAKDTPLAQGAGFLDAARAVRTTLTGPGTVDGGHFAWPHSPDQTSERTLTWTNDGDTPVTLRLTVDAHDASGADAPAGTAVLAEDSVTVPAKGSASVTLRLDASKKLPDDGYGEITGRVTATGDGGVSTVTAYGFHVEPHMVTLTFKGVTRSGVPAGLVSYVELLSPARNTLRRAYFADGTAELTVRAGRYDLDAALYGYDAGITEDDLYRNLRSVAVYVRPGQDITEDATVTLDGRTASRVEITGDRPLESRTAAVLFQRELTGGGVFDRSVSVDHAAAQDIAIGATPGGPDWRGAHVGYVSRAYAPLLDLRSDGGQRIDAHYSHYSPVTTDGISYLPVAGRARITDVGSGTAAELAAADVEGRMVLVDLGATDAGSVERLRTVTQDAVRRGARGVLVGHGFPGTWKPFTSDALPVLGVDQEDHALLRGLAAKGSGVRWSGVGSSPYVHNIALTLDDGIPADLKRRVRDRDMSRVTETWHSQLKDDRAGDAMAVRLAPGLDTVLTGVLQQVDAPSVRVARYTTGTGWLHLGSSSHTGTLETMTSRLRTWAEPGTDHESWYRGPLAPGAPSDVTTGGSAPMAVRQGDTVATALPVFGDGDGHYAYNALNDVVNTTLRRDGATVGTVRGSQGTWAVPAGSGRYELELDVRRNLAVSGLRDWKLSPTTRTTWAFDSATAAQTAPLPLLVPSYRAALDGWNRAPAVRHFPLVITARGQAGYGTSATAVTAEVSYDDGATWRKVTVRGDGKGAFAALVDNSPARAGFVSLRIRAEGTDGAEVTQTVVRAYAVR
ncbi:S8 family serine peptidase [Streptomyces zhihengii]|uniref:S8 family serine peptidase n=1 Tax=Streptomyces zhihengii TaxID=1818004 RepID=UPI00362B75EB